MQKKIITRNNDMPKNIWHCWRHRYFTTFRKRAWWKTCSVSSPTFVIYLWDLTETAQKTVHTGNGQPSATRELGQWDSHLSGSHRCKVLQAVVAPNPVSLGTADCHNNWLRMKSLTKLSDAADTNVLHNIFDKARLTIPNKSISLPGSLYDIL